MMKKPQAPVPQWDNIPAELKAFDQWVCWRYETKDSHWTKVPWRTDTNRRASSTDPQSWSSFEQTRQCYSQGGMDGVGFVFGENDLYTGIDLDDCINADGEISEEAQQTLNQLNTYAEISPSGTGIKLWCTGDVFPALGSNEKGEPRRGSKRGNYEAYSAKRFFTVTGQCLNVASIADAQEAIDHFVETYLTERVQSPSPVSPPRPHQPDDLIWSTIQRSKQASKIEILMKGDISDYGNDDSSADQALLCMLAFWFGPDPNRIEAAFSRSQLAQREKWKSRPDYRQRSIAKALSRQTQFYREEKQSTSETSTLQNAAAERAVLGSILEQPHSLDEVRLELQASDFYFQEHQRFFQGLCELADTQGMTCIDPITIAAYLDMPLEKIQTLQSALRQDRPVTHLVKLIRRLAERRALLAAGEWIMEQARRPAQPETLLDDAERLVLAIRDQRSKSQLISLGEATHLVLDRVQAVTDGVPIGLRTYLPKLDMYVSLKPQDLIVCAARPGVGKSIVGGQIALGNALAGKSILVASVEMAREDIAARMMSLHSSIDSSVTGARRIPTEQEAMLLTDASMALYHLHFKIDDSASQTLAQISANARRIQRQQGLDLLVVDYLQLVQCVRQRGHTRAEVLGELSRGLKRLAKELNIPILALAQLNRETQHKGEPELHHIRESGDIEQDADQVWLMWNDSQEEELVHIKVAKHRGGPCGKVTVLHDKRYMRFVECHQSHFGGKAYGR